MIGYIIVYENSNNYQPSNSGDTPVLNDKLVVFVLQ